MLKVPAAKSFASSPLQAAALRAKLASMRPAGVNPALNQRYYLRNMGQQAKYDSISQVVSKAARAKAGSV